MVGKSRKHEPAARARAHCVGRVAQPLAQAPFAAAEEACCETRGKVHARIAPQQQRASRRRPVATGRRPQECTSEGHHLSRLPGMRSRGQACGSGPRRADCAALPSATSGWTTGANSADVIRIRGRIRSVKDMNSLNEKDMQPNNPLTLSCRVQKARVYGVVEPRRPRLVCTAHPPCIPLHV